MHVLKLNSMQGSAGQSLNIKFGGCLRMEMSGVSMLGLGICLGTAHWNPYSVCSKLPCTLHAGQSHHSPAVQGLL